MTKIILDTKEEKPNSKDAFVKRFEQMVAEQARLTQFISDEIKDMECDKFELLLPRPELKERYGWSIRHSKMPLVWGIVEAYLRELKVKRLEENTNK